MNFDRYVGVPYRDLGRDHDGCDCYGLVVLVFAELRGVALPSFTGSYRSAADVRATAALIAGERDPWDEIAAGDEDAFDAVLLREGREVSHIGLVTSPGQMLHVARGHAARIERYRHGRLAHRIVGFYRFRGYE